jgi:hypothetical protein
MWAITHILFAYLHFIPGANGGWTQYRDYPLFSTQERKAIPTPFAGYWECVI